MTLTRLERQKRLRHRINLYLDGAYAFSILEETAIRAGLRVGDTFDERSLEELRSSAESDMAREKALALLQRRPHSSRELQQKLRGRKFSAEAITSAIERLVASGLVSDEAFARAFTHDALLRRPSGRIVLEQALRAKGVRGELARDIVRESLDGPREQEFAILAARKAARRRSGRSVGVDQQREILRVTRLLVRRGFSWPAVRTAINHVFGTDVHEPEGGI